ncbi:yjeF C-terminal region, hydroxyethylthiazole kinase-related [Sulfitobacter marinus]|uniref:ADP-dependent (S)-NAD(P)H-hydrate dehydratase n=1 Tax=Sulfitobacter marinus TaxID=394264 RepID=A0A1I6QSB3_9RHOB|nr:NAD(P)H-hydrate dehydratase [Sulfitobacter marinus]SFS55202.1 yjeF C-terminal region, hydroxyethylthiazole kinase-related [Sulfitobacter marinus]
MTRLEDQTPVFEMTDTHWRSLQKSGAAHKHRYGHAAVIAGPFGQGGAARLAARGALRIGAGLVSVVCRSDAVAEHAAQLNAIMVKPYTQDGEFQDHLTGIKPQAICIGPNLGLSSGNKTQVGQTLTLGLPMCIDADAITHLSDRGDPLPGISNPQSVMTPHEGELRRFIPEAFNTTSCRVTLAQHAAKKAGCVVLFKGPDTVVARPAHAPMIVSSKRFQHSSWLATAGSGDVLSGFITGLLARGFDAFDAACLAAELHFRCAEAFGPGLIAVDIPEMLPKVLR